MAKDLENFGPREMFFWLVLPLAAGAGLLAWGVALKKAELIAYRSDGPKMAVLIAAGTVLLMTWFLVVGMVLSKIWRRFGWRTTERSLSATAFSLTMLVAGIVPYLTVLATMDGYFDRLEMDALEQRGVPGKFSLMYSQRVRSRTSYYYQYTFFVPDSAGVRRELSIARSEDDFMDLKDTVHIMYLPANPTIFREAVQP